MGLISIFTKHLAVGFVIISTLIMGYILYELETTQQYFAHQLVEQSSDQIKTKLDEFFLPVEYLILTMKRQDSLGVFDKSSTEKFNRFFVPVIDQYPQISSVGLADGNGYELDILPDSTIGNWMNREVHVDSWGMIEKWSSWNIREGFSPVQTWEKKLLEDPRNRPWYKGAIQNNGRQIHWTKPYLFITNNEIGITASIQLTSDENIEYILALDLTLKDITRFSRGLDITENNQIFILTDNNHIIGLPRENPDINPENMMEKLLSTPQEFGNQLLISLIKSPRNKIITFESEGETWWGVIEPYSINSTQQILIAVLIPEKDFAKEINSTQKVMVGGFIGIILLASMLVHNHNRLLKAKASLNEQNAVIYKQKERLFAEVHHRVKNNLAIMSALIELENMDSTDVGIKDILTQNQRRVKSMAAVHEIMYKTDEINKVQITEFIPSILNFSKKDFQEADIELQQNIEDILINVNQALTYSLLLNEFMNSILKARLDLNHPITVQIFKKDNSMVTVIKLSTGTDFLKTRTGVGKKLIQVLIAQLRADLNINSNDNLTTYQISFELKDRKGITSSYN